MALASTRGPEYNLPRDEDTGSKVGSSRGVKIVAPGYGELACGTTGLGRMAEPQQIIDALNSAF